MFMNANLSNAVEMFVSLFRSRSSSSSVSSTPAKVSRSMLAILFIPRYTRRGETDWNAPDCSRSDNQTLTSMAIIGSFQVVVFFLDCTNIIDVYDAYVVVV